MVTARTTGIGRCSINCGTAPAIRMSAATTTLSTNVLARRTSRAACSLFKVASVSARFAMTITPVDPRVQGLQHLGQRVARVRSLPQKIPTTVVQVSTCRPFGWSGHPRAAAFALRQKPFPFESVVGRLDRVRVDRQPHRDRAHRRQLLAGTQHTAEDVAADLTLELVRNGISPLEYQLGIGKNVHRYGSSSSFPMARITSSGLKP